jgi:predicted acylesterase/phospholipase RssA
MNTVHPQEPGPLGSPPPADRFCDLVLTGGVASGVVYPWLVHELARHYHFRSLGGTSVGALAAALTAACEFGRRTQRGGYEVLRQLPGRLAEHDQRGRTRMLGLFQPAPGGERLFELVLALLRIWSPPDAAADARAGWRKAPALAGRVFALYDGAFLLLLVMACSVLGGLLLGRPEGIWPWLAGLACAALASVLALLLTALRIWWDFRRHAMGNDWGLCRGRATGDSPREGLTEWLHHGLQLAAGRDEPNDPPLTFRELQNCPLPMGGRDGAPGIDLRMMCTLLSQARSLQLPLRDFEPPLYYRPQEWAPFFPPPVMAHLERVSTPLRSANPMGLRRLPGLDLPVLVAARLSMSFPLLLSMVPVYALDAGAPLPAHETTLRRAWCTDGGVCANFPVQLFDAAHPAWPTFGIWLDQRRPDGRDQPIWMASGPEEGSYPAWLSSVPDSAKAEPSGPRPGWWALLGLCGAYLETLMSWNDRATFRLPSQRARILRLALQPWEGSLNLQMPGQQILQMAADYGLGAAAQLFDQFLPRNQVCTPTWEEHLFVRSHSLLRALRQLLQGYPDDLAALAGHGVALRDLLRQGLERGLLRGQPQASLTPAELQQWERALAAVETLARALEPLSELGDSAPRPPAELRLRDP